MDLLHWIRRNFHCLGYSSGYPHEKRTASEAQLVDQGLFCLLLASDRDAVPAADNWLGGGSRALRASFEPCDTLAHISLLLSEPLGVLVELLSGCVPFQAIFWRP